MVVQDRDTVGLAGNRWHVDCEPVIGVLSSAKRPLRLSGVRDSSSVRVTVTGHVGDDETSVL